MEKRRGNQRKVKPIKKFTNRMSARLMFVFGVVLALMSVLIVRIATLNHTDGVRYEKRVLSQQTYTSTAVPYQRGSIFDRNGTVLAYSEKVYNVILDVYYALSDEKYSEPTRKALADSFKDVTEKTVNDLYKNKPNSRYSIIKKGITYDDMEKFKKLEEKDENIQGVWFEEDYNRKYPYKTIASDVLGFTASGNVGTWGIEQYYSDILNGTNGIEFGYIDTDLKLKRTVKPAINGSSIVSTIDSNVQKAVEEQIKAFNTEYGSKNMGVVVMNPNNGEILAMASNEAYDLNNPTDLTPFYTKDEIDKMSDKEKLAALNKIWRNYTISDAYEPGSTFKPFTIAAGLEENVIKQNDTFYCDGVEDVAGTLIHCSNRSGHGEVTLTQALMKSCNDALMQIGAKEGSNLFSSYQKFFGFGTKTGIDLPGEANGILIAKDKLGKVDLATNSFGQNFTSTMIQMAAGFSSLVNGGYYYEPHVMKEVLNASGGIASAYDKKLVKLSVSSNTSEFLRDALYLTVQEGTAQGAQVPGYKVGGKTGTAQKSPRADRTYLVSFIGCVPTDNPQVVIYVVIDEPQNVIKQADSSLATKAAGAILKEILPLLEIYPTEKSSDSTGAVSSGPGQNTGTAGNNSGEAAGGQSAEEQNSSGQTGGGNGETTNTEGQAANGGTQTGQNSNEEEDPDALPD
ncbi:peptidoglycan D,D-transpeptidase FtsI family protein [Anaerocolumna xylanovorans]|uniref:Stage V sporulation protein D (Sporulation-specific penicillin-binding protein) n=1 Tax=Anaerocolumna xylanovorans DSM 12503 TaxID=1121345 RepID=A0A1M7YBC9_9FIRM|nr:penicillin-binding protein 2 [Anaerocolumna xylanovorans]SHO49960.1 stage V sporulation protein D (sporulation-specific penicillin-binding protein) [Anaerocolumna xylanovorans DSM 12503]